MAANLEQFPHRRSGVLEHEPKVWCTKWGPNSLFSHTWSSGTILLTIIQRRSGYVRDVEVLRIAGIYKKLILTIRMRQISGINNEKSRI